MALTENAKIIYLSTNLGEVARKVEDFETFKSRWCAKIIMLSISKKEEDKKILEAMRAVDLGEFYYDANR